MEEEEMVFVKCPHVQLEPHECAYESDVNDNHENFCTCCDKCQEQCAWDI